MIVALVVGLAQAAQPCPAATTVAQLEERLQKAEQAYGDLDADGFLAELDESALLLPCLDALVSPKLAARVHRLEGIRLFAARDRAGAKGAFASAVAADPRYAFPPDLVPEGHGIRGLYAEADPDASQLTPVPAVDGGTLFFDGSVASERPDRPTVVQVHLAGSVDVTRYLLPNDPMPPYPVLAPPPEPEAMNTTTPVVVQRPPPPLNVPLAVVSGGLGLAALAVYGSAALDAQDFDRANARVPLNRLESQRKSINQQVYVSMGLGGVAVAGGVGSFLLRPGRE